MEALQNLLTIATEVIAITGLTGIIAHAIWSQHCRFMTDYCPAVAPFQKEAVVTQPSKTNNRKKATQPKLQPTSVGSAAIDYTKLTSEQLRKECALQGIN